MPFLFRLGPRHRPSNPRRPGPGSIFTGSGCPAAGSCWPLPSSLPISTSLYVANAGSTILRAPLLSKQTSSHPARTSCRRAASRWAPAPPAASSSPPLCRSSSPELQRALPRRIQRISTPPSWRRRQWALFASSSARVARAPPRRAAARPLARSLRWRGWWKERREEGSVLGCRWRGRL